MIYIKDKSLGAWHIEEGMNNKVTVIHTESGKNERACKDLSEAFQHISNLRFFNEITEPLNLHEYILARQKIGSEIRAAQEGMDLIHYLTAESIKKGIENNQENTVNNPIMQTQE